MAKMPLASIPLNQHSIQAIELWLEMLGANKVDESGCNWNLDTPHWSALIKLEQEDLLVSWHQSGDLVYECTLPYGLSREDVESAIRYGPR